MSVQEAQLMAANQRFVQFVAERLRFLNMAPNEFMRRVYGGRQSSAERILQGQSRARMPTLQQWAPVLGCSVEYLAAKYDPLPKDETIVPNPAPDYPRLHVPQETIRPAGAIRPIFTFSVNVDGTADVKLDLRNVPVGVAMDVVSVLQRSGFFTTEATVKTGEDHR